MWKVVKDPEVKKGTFITEKACFCALPQFKSV